MNKAEVESVIHALLASSKDGILLDNLNDEFYGQTYMDIPYLSLGYSSLHELIRNLKNVSTRRNVHDEVVYVLKSNRNVDHIVQMVKNHKDPSSRSNQRITIMKKIANRRRKPRNYRPSRRNSEGEDTSESHDSYGEDSQRPVIISSPPKYTNLVHTPIIKGQQLIGDDFFLQLAIRNLKQPIWRTRECGPLRCGLCISGLTVRAAINQLKSVESVSNRIILMIGAEDLYRGRTADDISEDFKHLLDILHSQFALSESAIKICTIPPLANLGLHDQEKKIMNMHEYNHALRLLAHQWGHPLIDFYNHYTTPNLAVVYDCFQIDARMVSGSSHPYVLFNKRGRRLAVNLLDSFHSSHTVFIDGN